MDILSPWHLLIILLIVLVIFGPRNLGDVGAAMGKAIRDFKNSMTADEDLAKQRETTPHSEPSSSKSDNNPTEKT